jgi:hypothetical protein
LQYSAIKTVVEISFETSKRNVNDQKNAALNYPSDKNKFSKNPLFDGALIRRFGSS